MTSHYRQALVMCGTCLTAVLAFTANSTAQTKPTLTTLYNFALDAAAGGAYLNGGLVIGSGGVLYGTTTYGGAGPCTSTTYGPGCGTVFSLTPPASPGGAWTEAVLYSFNGGSDGANPLAGVAIGSGGALYGTTSEGGPSGAGTVFSLTPPVSPDGTWSESVLHSFTGVNGDGREPYMGSLAIDGSGALYGMTYAGGTPAGNCSLGCGTVFELAPPASAGGAWTESVIHSFTLENGDGGYPLAGVVIGSGGVLYGASEFGGTGGSGMVFSLTPPAAPGGAWTESVIYSFTNRNGDGGEPQSDLIIGSGGVLYGTTAFGGDVDSAGGTVFSLTPPVATGGVWTEAVIWTFKQENRPQSSLVIGGGGVLYGTTPVGGRHDAGIVFSLRPRGAGVWTPAVLHSFNLNHSGQGLYPIGGVVIGAGGVLYGTTRGSASKGPPSYTHGTVFSLTP